MATPVRRTLPRLEATGSTPLTDDLLEEIFLRIACPTDLARVSTACVSFRRLIADPTFLRKYRSRHPPLLLGFLHPMSGKFQPAEAPHPSAPAARALAGASDFSFQHYIPRGFGSRWYIRDARDGRVLLESVPDDLEDAHLLDLAVCCPLSRRYLLLPPLPDELFQVQGPIFRSVEAFLVPSDDWEDTSFRVIAKTYYMKKLAIFVFFSGSNHWNAGTVTSWEALSLPPDSRDGNLLLAMSCFHSYAYGCFYWKLHLKNKVIKFDMNNMEFCTVDLPPEFDNRNIVIVEAGEGMLGMFSPINNGTALHYTVRKNLSESSNEAKMDNIIPLPVGYVCNDVVASGGYVFLIGRHTAGLPNSKCFSLDIKTLKIEAHSNGISPYFGYPPFLSPRRI